MSDSRFIEKVSGYVAAHGLLRADAPVIVAVSGGADSVALLSALHSLEFRCTAAHCNFHLRGAESTRDMRSVEALADRLGVDLYVKDFDVAGRRSLTGESLEMACRELRYEWFASLLDRDCAQAVAVGHHAEDQAETFFLNLLRGTGVAGLSGMRPRQGNVVRPLLECTREEIVNYLRGQGLGWVEDSTNASDDFARNRLRNHLLPLLEELFPGARRALARTMANLRENSDFYADAVRAAAAPFIAPNGEVDLAALCRVPHAPLLLFEALRTEGFTRSQTDDMLRAGARGTAAEFHARGARHSRTVDHGRLRPARADVLSPLTAADISPLHDIAEPVRIAVSRHNVAHFKPEGSPRVLYLDARCLDGGPHRWQLRRWQRADRMQPFGMTGTKLLSDIFAAARLSRAQKEDVWLLTRNDEILWVVGLRASAHWPVGPSTREYLRLEYLDESTT